MQNTKLAVQIENTLNKSVTDLLCDNSAQPTWISISNLMNYIQAIVLFEEVHLPSRPQRKHMPTEIVPEILKRENIFIDDVVEDFKYRIETAQKKAMALADLRHLPTSSADEIIPNSNEGQIYVDIIERIMASHSEGEERQFNKAFWNDIDALMRSEKDYETEGVEKVLDHFKGSEYAAISDEKKIGVYYLWRCFYNVELAVDRDRIYFYNHARTTFVNEAYSMLKREVFNPDLFSEYPTDLKAWLINNIAPRKSPENVNDKNRDAWRIYLPVMLHEVLKTAHYEKSKIPEAIIDFRNSRKARAFREHYKAIREKSTTVAVIDEMNDDMKHLSELSGALSDLGQTTAALGSAFFKNYSIPSELLKKSVNFGFLMIRYRHLRMFWMRPLMKRTVNRELRFVIDKTFGLIHD